jgi:hypothetical protein
VTHDQHLRHGCGVPGAIIRRDFTVNATKVNSRWCGDITHVGTWEGWLAWPP